MITGPFGSVLKGAVFIPSLNEKCNMVRSIRTKHRSGQRMSVGRQVLHFSGTLKNNLSYIWGWGAGCCGLNGSHLEFIQTYEFSDLDVFIPDYRGSLCVL